MFTLIKNFFHLRSLVNDWVSKIRRELRYSLWFSFFIVKISCVTCHLQASISVLHFAIEIFYRSIFVWRISQQKMQGWRKTRAITVSDELPQTLWTLCTNVHIEIQLSSCHFAKVYLRTWEVAYKCISKTWTNYAFRNFKTETVPNLKRVTFLWSESVPDTKIFNFAFRAFYLPYFLR